MAALVVAFESLLLASSSVLAIVPSPHLPFSPLPSFPLPSQPPFSPVLPVKPVKVFHGLRNTGPAFLMTHLTASS